MISFLLPLCLSLTTPSATTVHHRPPSPCDSNQFILNMEVLAGKRKPIPDQHSIAKAVDITTGSESSQKSKSLIELLKKKVSKKANKR